MLEPGHYKIKTTFAYETSFSYLKVEFKKGKYVLTFNNSFTHIVNDQDALNAHMSGVEVIKKITHNNPPEYSSVRVKVSFKDEDGDKFEMTAANSIVLKDIWESFPRLAKKFFY
ncbi:MAG: hypothetical protein OCD76_03090 [Reichenbachiella sp.]